MALAELLLGSQSGEDTRLIEWGGVWDSRLVDLLDDYSNAESTPAQRMKTQLQKYKARFQRMYKRPAFVDGVHFQISSDPN